MKRANLKHAAVLAFACLFIAGCIPVKNVEKAWNNAKADDAIVGQWVGGNDGKSIIGFVKTEQGFLVTSGTSGLEGGCRSIETNGHKYLIVAKLRAAVLGFDQVDEDTKGGTLTRYSVEGDQLTLYTYKQNHLKSAVKDGKVPGEIDENDNPSLTELDATTIQWLGKIADEEGWDVQTYKRK